MTSTTSSSSSARRPSGRWFDHQFFQLYSTALRQNLIPMGMYQIVLLLITVLPDYSYASQMDLSIMT